MFNRTTDLFKHDRIEETCLNCGFVFIRHLKVFDVQCPKCETKFKIEVV